MYKNYDVKTIESGVYGAIASDAGAAGSNSGIIDLGNETIIFDTSATLSAAAELLEIARERTGRTPKYVINSHSHPDHIHGNAVFYGHSTLISSSITRKEIEQHGATEMQNMKSDISTQLEHFQSRLLEDELSESERIELLAYTRAFQSVLNGYPTERDLRLPELTFEHSLSFHGTSRSAYLLTFGGAHSQCDSVLWLPNEKIMFVGDLVIPDGNLILCLGVPEHWPDVLRHLEEFDAKTLVPGHGDIVSAENGFSASRAYLEVMFHLAREAVKSGFGSQYAYSMDAPPERSEYWFRKDLAFLIDRHMAGGCD